MFKYYPTGEPLFFGCLSKDFKGANAQTVCYKNGQIKFVGNIEIKHLFNIPSNALVKIFTKKYNFTSDGIQIFKDNDKQWDSISMDDKTINDIKEWIML